MFLFCFLLIFRGSPYKNPTHLQAQQIALSEKYEQLSDKVNAEFNKQFVANL
ncbi:hypothetical protein D032_4857 [Vibrio parahaemolyticus V14/01]|nr:hypothetical protein D032_4857 [Vibrio parahaemolyticus V14/01]